MHCVHCGLPMDEIEIWHGEQHWMHEHECMPCFVAMRQEQDKEIEAAHDARIERVVRKTLTELGLI